MHAMRRCCLARREINLILCGGVARRQITHGRHGPPNPDRCCRVPAPHELYSDGHLDSDTTEAEDSLL